MKTGAKDRAAQKYDFVFEDQIDFIKDQALAGELVRAQRVIVLCANAKCTDKNVINLTVRGETACSQGTKGHYTSCQELSPVMSLPGKDLAIV